MTQWGSSSGVLSLSFSLPLSRRSLARSLPPPREYIPRGGERERRTECARARTAHTSSMPRSQRRCYGRASGAVSSAGLGRARPHARFLSLSFLYTLSLHLLLPFSFSRPLSRTHRLVLSLRAFFVLDDVILYGASSLPPRSCVRGDFWSFRVRRLSIYAVRTRAVITHYRYLSFSFSPSVVHIAIWRDAIVTERTATTSHSAYQKLDPKRLFFPFSIPIRPSTARRCYTQFCYTSSAYIKSPSGRLQHTAQLRARMHTHTQTWTQPGR